MAGGGVLPHPAKCCESEHGHVDPYELDQPVLLKSRPGMSKPIAQRRVSGEPPGDCNVLPDKEGYGSPEPEVAAHTESVKEEEDGSPTPSYAPTDSATISPSAGRPEPGATMTPTRPDS